MPDVVQTMRVSTYSTGTGVTTALRQLTNLLAAPAPSLPDRYPDRPARNLPDTARVVEGELLRPAPAPESLITLFQASTIAVAARRIDTPTLPAVPSQSGPGGIQFYLLHSSIENLATYTIGRNLNLYA